MGAVQFRCWAALLAIALSLAPLPLGGRGGAAGDPKRANHITNQNNHRPGEGANAKEAIESPRRPLFLSMVAALETSGEPISSLDRPISATAPNIVINNETANPTIASHHHSDQIDSLVTSTAPELVALDAALVSGRGSLAIWRQLAPPSSLTSTSSPEDANQQLDSRDPLAALLNALNTPELSAATAASRVAAHRRSAGSRLVANSSTTGDFQVLTAPKCNSSPNSNNFHAKTTTKNYVVVSRPQQHPTNSFQIKASAPFSSSWSLSSTGLIANPAIANANTNANNNWQILVVEGTNLQLNFLARLQATSSVPNPKNKNKNTNNYNNNNNNNEERPPPPAGQLTASWSRNGRPLELNSPPQGITITTSNNQQGGSTLRSSSSSNKHSRFSQLILLSPGDQLGSSISDSSPGQRITSDSQASMAADGSQQAPLLGSSFSAADEWQQFQSFMLAPHINEQLVARLVAPPRQFKSTSLLVQELRQLKGLLTKRMKQMRPSSQDSSSSILSSEPLSLPDEFLAGAIDSEQVDWARASTLLSESVDQMNGQELEEASAACNVEVPQLAQNNANQQQHEQLALLRLSISRLQMEDAGQYQVRICLAQSSQRGQQSGAGAVSFFGGNVPACVIVNFELLLAPDWPKLESWPQAQLLEPGERLSIKCQASGFTLPQISWFLDNQLISEQQSSSMTASMQLLTGGSSTGSLGGELLVLDSNGNGGSDDSSVSDRAAVASPQARLALPSRFRVGDYVSQDNQVHSFINASHVLATDGGFYKCQANNGLHRVDWSTRIDVRGPPLVARPMANLSVLVGTPELHIQCPYSGHPIGLIEWFFKPSSTSAGDSAYSSGGRLNRARRLVQASSRPQSQSVVHLLRHDPDEEQPELETDRDIWLSQANAMTSSTSPSPDDENSPPDFSWPDADYPSALIPASDSFSGGPNDYNGFQPALELSLLEQQVEEREQREAAAVGEDSQPFPNLASNFDLEPETFNTNNRPDDRRAAAEKQRDKRQINGGPANAAQVSSPGASDSSSWFQFPQSRRHQIHHNGTLVIQSVSRSDQGQYKCRVLAPHSPPSGGSDMSSNTHNNNPISYQAPMQQQATPSPWSNEFHLNVQVPPVISPFSSSDSLREGMRNFLTCSVIEGDPPVRLSWFKDGNPIEDYILARSSAISSHIQWPSTGASLQQQQQGSPILPASNEPQSNNNNNNNNNDAIQIRVDTSNEFTSTLYFQHVDFRDNGNYTCMASNKAASVNYTTRMLVNVPPKWIKAPKDVECIAGQNIIIDCQAQAFPNPRLWWEIGVYTTNTNNNNNNPSGGSINSNAESQQANSKSGQLVRGNPYPGGQSQFANFPPNHYRTIISNSRTHILENASLVIKDVARHDAGHYLCQAANNFGSLSALIKLTVNVGATFSQKYAIKYVKLNENVELDCDPSGQSPVDIIWFQRPNHQQHHQQHISHATSSQDHGSILAPANHANSNSKQLIFNLTTITSPNGNRNMQLLSPNSQQTTINHHANNNYNNNEGSPISKHASAAAPYSQSSLDQSSFPDGSMGRRLFSGTIRTELNAPSQGGSLTVGNNMNQQTTGDQWGLEAAGNNLAAGNQPQQTTMVELDSSMAFELMRRPDGAGEMVRMLIKQAKRTHSADFICQASNRFGNEEKLIRLLVQEPPDPVTEVSSVRIDSRSIILAWQPPYAGNLPITSYTIEWRPLHLQQPQHKQIASTTGQLLVMDPSQERAATALPWSYMSNNGQQPSATIGSLEPKTSYEFRIRAHNQLGSSRVINNNNNNNQDSGPMLGHHVGSHIVVYTTLEEAPSAPPVDVRAIPLSSSSLQVSWLPPNINEQQQHSPLSTGPAATNDNKLQQQNTINNYKQSIKGYMVGYSENNSNSSFTYKTISLSTTDPTTDNWPDSTSPFLVRSNSNHHRAAATPAGANQTGNELGRLRVIINELKRSTSYTIHVQAINSAGSGPQSDPIQARTLLNDPPPAAQLRVLQSYHNSLALQWSFPEYDSSRILLSDYHDYSHSKLSHVSNGGSRTRGLVSAGSESVELESKDSDSTNSPFPPPIEGYSLYYRMTDGSWIERHLTPQTHSLVAIGGLSNGPRQRAELSLVETHSQQAPDLSSGDESSKSINRGQALTQNSSAWSHHAYGASVRYLLDQLSCGSSYQLYLIAYNSIGSGSPSQIVRAKTNGEPPTPPSKSMFIKANISSALLNLDGWEDHGCPIVNFEIRYKSLRSSAAHHAANHQHQSTSEMQAPIGTLRASGLPSVSSNSDWLLLSNNINPDLRELELRDLQPESWYLVLALAESASGKTEQEFKFMTLDKYGQLPPEANTELGGSSPFPAFFQSPNSTLRAILNNLTPSGVGGQGANPLLLSGCLFLILFIGCLVFQLRSHGNRYNNSAGAKDNASLDSGITGVTNYTDNTSHHHDKFNGSKPNGHLGTRTRLALRESPYKLADVGHQLSQPTGLFPADSTIAANCSSSTPPSECLDQQQHPSPGTGANYGECNMISRSIGTPPQMSTPSECLHHAHFQAHDQHQHQSLPLAHKFTTLARPNPHHNQEGVAMGPFGDHREMGSGARFRTMQHRPVSSFIPNHHQQLVNRQQFVSFCNNDSKQSHLTNPNQPAPMVSPTDQQQHNQIYSKLRLFYNANVANEISPQQQHESTTSLFENNHDQSDTLNLAHLLEHQADHQPTATNNQHAKLMDINKRDSSIMNHYNNNNSSSLLTNGNGNGNILQQQLPTDFGQLIDQGLNQPHDSLGHLIESNANIVSATELSSFLMDCQQQQQMQCHNNNQNENNNRHQITYDMVAPHATSLSSCAGSTSMGSSQSNSHHQTAPPTGSSQISSSLDSSSTNTHALSSDQHQQQLININNKINNNQQNNGNPTPVNCQQQHQNGVNNAQQQSNGSMNEQSDYALPFPPKWV